MQDHLTDEQDVDIDNEEIETKVSRDVAAGSVEDVEGVLGISIGQRQAYMKSTLTPAIEKSKALEESQGYFDVGLNDEADRGPISRHEARETLPGNTSSAGQTSVEKAQAACSEEHLPSLWTDKAAQPGANGHRPIQENNLASSRPRSSSGSRVRSKSLRKLLPDFPSLHVPKVSSLSHFTFGTKPKNEIQVVEQNTLFSKGDGMARTNNANEQSVSPAVSPSMAKASSRLSESHGAPRDGPTVLLRYTSFRRAVDPHRPRRSCSDHGDAASTFGSVANDHQELLRHATSDNSLYLHSTPTRSSTFDDTTRWDNISDQVNSRVKAIKDSFHDSRIRMPKLPNVSIAGYAPSSFLRTNSDLGDPHARSRMSEIPWKFQARPVMSPVNTTTRVAPTEARHVHPIMGKALTNLTGDVVVLGGYRGSVLRSAKPPHRQLWIPVKAGLNLRKVDLELGLTREDEEAAEQTVIASGTLSHIGPVDICRRLLRHLRKSPNVQTSKLRVHDYGYDWRLSPNLLSRKLIDFVERLECNHHETPSAQRGAIVVAHSLGGLITRHAINERPELFAGIVYAGVPQHCVNILGPLRNGDDVLLSSRILTAQVNFTLRTSFALLPESGHCFIDKSTGESYDVDFFDEKTWDEYRLSPCINPPLTPPYVADHRKSLLGSLADSFTENLPSLPSSKRSSWAQVKVALQPDQAIRATEKVKATVKNPVDGAGDAGDKAEDTLNKGGQPFQPSMGNASQARFDSSSIATACTIPYEEAMQYLSRTLACAAKFKQELSFLPDHHASNVYPPVSIIYGRSVPTVFGARVSSRAAIKYTDAYDDLAFASGDGVVLASAAQLPKGYRCVKGGRIESERGHVGLLGDIEAVGKALCAIIEARANGVGLGQDRIHLRKPAE